MKVTLEIDVIGTNETNDGDAGEIPSEAKAQALDAVVRALGRVDVVRELDHFENWRDANFRAVVVTA